MSRVYRLDISKQGRKNVPALLNLLSHSQLGISRSYYNKLRKSQKLTDSLKSKIEKLVNARDHYSLALTRGNIPKISLPPTLKKKLNIKSKDYVWAKFKFSSTKGIYYASAVIPKEYLNKFSSFIKGWLESTVKLYEEKQIYIHAISLQNI